MVLNGGSPNFKELLSDEKTTCIAKISHSLSYKACSITLPKFNKFGLFIPILGASAIMDQTACFYNVTTSEQVYRLQNMAFYRVSHKNARCLMERSMKTRSLISKPGINFDLQIFCRMDLTIG